MNLVQIYKGEKRERQSGFKQGLSNLLTNESLWIFFGKLNSRPKIKKKNSQVLPIFEPFVIQRL